MINGENPGMTYANTIRVNMDDRTSKGNHENKVDERKNEPIVEKRSNGHSFD